jgi:hypothetical protein
VVTSEEMCDHLFVECDVFVDVWRELINLLGISYVFPNNICDHALQFCGAFLFGKDTQDCLEVI